MGRVIIPLLVFSVIFLGCSLGPDEYRDAAFKQYSLDCVARGIPEDTEAHTQCVVEKFDKYVREQQRGEDHMRGLLAKQEAATAKADLEKAAAENKITEEKDAN